MAKKRLNYFTGEFLKEDDFRTEQQYHVDMQRLHSKNLHEWGIADGLDVTFKPGEKKVTISEGMAVDADGKQIVLDEYKEIDLSTSTPTVYISISYKETFGDSRTDTGITGFARIIEEPELKYPNKPSDPSMALILAKVTLNADKTIASVDTSERKRAGVVAGDLEANSVAFTLPIAKNLWPRIKGVVTGGTGGLGIDAPGGANFSGALTVGGNAGIGTASPESKLHVSGGDIRLDANRELLFKDNGQIRSLDNNHRILFRRTENKMELREYGDLVFSPGATAGAETAKAVMLGNGNVGIGTPNPGEKLEIVGNLKIAANDTYLDFGADTRQMINLWGTAPNSPYGIGVQAWTQYYRTAGNFAWYIGGTHSDVELDPGAGGTAAMIIKRGTGNVGIGTTNPADKLDVAGNLRILTGSNPIRFTAAWSGFPDPATNQAEISNDTGTYKTLMIIGNKSGGLGRRVSVWDRLEVNGTLNVTGSLDYGQLTKLDVADNFTAIVRCADFTIGHSSRRGSPGRALVDLKDTLVLNYGPDWPYVKYYGQWGAVSSRELKENIDHLSAQEAFETLENLNPVKFNLRSDEEKRTQVGFVSEDVPDLAASADRKAVIFNHIVAVLTKVVKEQQRTIAELTENLNSWEKQRNNRGAVS